MQHGVFLLLFEAVYYGDVSKQKAKQLTSIHERVDRLEREEITTDDVPVVCVNGGYKEVDYDRLQTCPL